MGGGQDTWFSGAAGVVVYRGDNITIRGNFIHGNGFGIFTKSTGSGAFLVENLLVEANHILDNGNPGSHFEHNVYSQGANPVYQFNRIGTVTAGSGGTPLKDRSTGPVVRYNWFDDGFLDLVAPEEHYESVKDRPDFHTAHVYGNVFRASVEGDLIGVVHFGDEHGHPKAGPLFFYHNTVYIRAGESSWRTIVFRVDNPIAVVSVVNNVLHRTGGRPDSPGLALMNVHGKAILGVNWISEGWREGHEQDWA
ncbi:MAG: right-handed parallel beta-helix repeat-containing protein, partial [Deltaproteobacteria bacterium]|nr:right-handed parallel beta-helix repeat-containing protein [Deltaproteobacteria bacterium]